MRSIARLRRHLAGAGVVLGLLCAGCGSDDSPAVWELAPDARVTGESSTLPVLVSRVGCSSGVQGEVQAPDVELSATEVVVTFRISPEINGGTCEGVPGVAFDLVLGEPLGERSLVDGECRRTGSTARGTSFCLDDGVRYPPADPG